ncbi:TauD/TfdA family dioxygenase [Sneathiella marina]|uniref:TauD/TfdA family dioxygenase n=1 Tax=Sneathiella marina TaxID=2950108 RepID=A0ABY4W5W4_9PROT|nr:TauD/TfdA family dioxygenase [Sneathiella marina]USG62586.1 TauD/TfdA family dioxygenase [Sneathiella marina]
MNNHDRIDVNIEGPTAWTTGSLGSVGGVFGISDACYKEIQKLATFLEENPLPVTSLNSAEFDLPHCRAIMQEVKGELEKGCGFALIDRLPLEYMPPEIAISIYWVLMGMIGRAVAQKWDGKMVYGVADSTGKQPGNGIRADVTNAEQNFHTDNSYNICPPDHVTLLCLHPARDGGISRVVSLNTAHNRLRESHPELLERLYEPFYFDRQREHGPEDRKIINRPIFSVSNGRLKSRLSASLVRQGYELAEKPLDVKGQEAIAALYEILDDPDLYREFFFKPGQIQIVDNRMLAHKRTQFSDWPEPERKRRLIRLWLRQDGRTFYNG